MPRSSSARALLVYASVLIKTALRETGLALTSDQWARLVPWCDAASLAEKETWTILLNWAALMLMRDSPNLQQLGKLREACETILQKQEKGHRQGSGPLSRVCALAGAVSGLVALRALWQSGRRSRRRAARWTKGFADGQGLVIARRGPATSEADANGVLSLLKLQCRSWLSPVGTPGGTVIYLLSLGPRAYVGRSGLGHVAHRGLAGPVLRREQHQKALVAQHLGQEASSSRRSRYRILTYGQEARFIEMMALIEVAKVDQQTVETHVICDVRPEGNQLLWTPGVKKQFQGFSRETPEGTTSRRKRASCAHRLRRLREKDVEFEPDEEQWKYTRLRRAALDVESHERRQSQQRLLRVELERPFKERYRRLLKNVYEQTGALGPLHIYAGRGAGITAISLAAETNGVVKWDTLLRHQGKGLDHMYCLLEVAGLLGGLRKARAIGSIKKFMCGRGLPTSSVIPIGVPTNAMARTARAYVREVIKPLWSWAPVLAAEIRKRSMPIEKPLKNWKLTLVNVQALSRSFSFEWFRDLKRTDLTSARRGEDMQRIPYDAKMQRRPCQEEVLQATEAGRREWLRRTGLVSLFGHDVVWPDPSRVGEGAAVGPFWTTEATRLADDAFSECERQLGEKEPSPDGAVNTIADKDPNVVWTMKSVYAFARWIGILYSQGRWSVECFSSQAVLDYYRKISNAILPRSLLPWHHEFQLSNIPYVYPSVKEKCFTGDRSDPNGIHSCLKESHACMRNIVSFLRFPGREIFKSVGRGLRHLNQEFQKGWALENLTSATEVIKKAYNRQMKKSVPPEGRKCLCCRCPLKSPGAITADAGQAYEVLEPSFVKSSVQKLFSRAGLRQGRDKTITVRRSIAHQAHGGGHIWHEVSDRRVFWLSKLKHSVSSLLQCRVYQLGDRFLVQRKGLPIGGPISGGVLDVCLSNLEENFDKNKWSQFAREFGRSGSRQLFVSTVRYVDDTLFISLWLCNRCLKRILQETYASQVQFDVNTISFSEPGVTHVKFLDFWITIGYQHIHFSPDIKNEEHILTNGQKRRTKQRFPPLYGPVVALKRRVRQDLLGRLARIRQISPPKPDIIYALTTDFWELGLLGYPYGFIKRLWFSLPMQDHVHCAGQLCLATLKSSWPASRQ